jgi:glucose-6-phosphate isomerase
MIETSFKFNFASSEVIDSYAKRINDEYESGEIGYYHLPVLGQNLLARSKSMKRG